MISVYRLFDTSVFTRFFIVLIIRINDYKDFFMYYAYIRVSTDHQNVENQKHEILTYSQKHDIQIDKWIDETISSRKPLTERKLGKLLKRLMFWIFLNQDLRFLLI